MSVCSPCLKVCNVPLCTSEIILGTISSIDTDIKIIVENKTKGGKKIISTQSDGAGLVTLVTAGLGLMPDQSYNISVILADATALCDTETLTIGTSTASCVTVIFENVKDSNNCNVVFESQTLTAVDENNQPITSECCEPIEHTVAEMQALVGSFEPNRWYIITDPQSSFGVLRVRARDVSNLERSGTLIKDNLSYSVDYDLSADKFRAFNDAIYNNRFTTSADSEGDCITNFPFNNPNYNNNNGDDFFISIDTVANASISRVDFGKTTIVAITTVSGNVTLTDCIFGQLATITLSSASLVKCTIGQGIALELVPGQSYTDKIVNAFKSNFDRARVITGVAVFDFITGGVNENYVGIFNITSANASETITSFTNHSATHDVTFRGETGKTFTFQHNGVDIICKGAADAVLSTENDYVTFRFVGNTAIEMERGNY